MKNGRRYSLSQQKNESEDNIMSNHRNKTLRVFFAAMLIAAFFVLPAAASGDVFEAGKTLLGDVQKWFLIVSTPAAAVGSGFGLFQKVTSAGDHQKIEMGNRAIKTSIIGWAGVNGLTLILNTIQKYIA